jgi:hypothetical protein
VSERVTTFRPDDRDEPSQIDRLAPLLWCVGWVEVGGGPALLRIGDMAVGLGRTYVRQSLIERSRPLLCLGRRLWRVLRRPSACLLNPLFTIHPPIVTHPCEPADEKVNRRYDRLRRECRRDGRRFSRR